MVFLRNLDEIPAEPQRELATLKPAAPAGKPVAISLDGEIIDLGGRQAYLDATQGRVMVPLRPLVEALGGKVDWYPVSLSREIEAEHNYGQPPTGAVAARVETTLGDKLGSILQRSKGSVVVPCTALP